MFVVFKIGSPSAEVVAVKLNPDSALGTDSSKKAHGAGSWKTRGNRRVLGEHSSGKLAARPPTTGCVTRDVPFIAYDVAGDAAPFYEEYLGAHPVRS